MRLLLASNPGFDSRIKEYLEFPDYTDQEMCEIFVSMAKDNGFDTAGDAYSAITQRIQKERRLRSFGNARTIRNILDEAIDRHSLNYVTGKLGEEDKFRLRGIDISTELKRNGF